ncbi:Oidioi.mRNA.OKI2018_I69.chr1.g3608.t1.cds [Oikopleura dioica]|uniref:Hexosyltransferase n=1 Tax=Oikopleura dioica TaxID=34765 RepID=A0ABN7SUG8_OIKDI|nr:Oidioi.mRNA.OKI2018_I69.chr1.g3608.t1.cds [Oikopleura dioica]
MRVTSKIYTFGSIFLCLFLVATVVSNFKSSETTRDRSKRDIKSKKIVANDFIPEAFFRERQHSGKTTTPSFSEDTLLHSFKCPETENDLVLVTTNARNPQKLHRRFYSKYPVEVRFLIGFTEDPLPTDFDDYVIGSYNETYENLYLKTGSAFEFVSKCGLSKQKVTMVDDDTIFYAGDKMPDEDIVCGYRLNSMTEKMTTGKWALTEQQWPSGVYFPGYCGGACKTLSAETMKNIYSVSIRYSNNNVTFEDLMYTGIFRVMAGLPTPLHAPELCRHYNGNYINLNWGMHLYLKENGLEDFSEEESRRYPLSENSKMITAGKTRL